MQSPCKTLILYQVNGVRRRIRRKAFGKHVVLTSATLVHGVAYVIVAVCLAVCRIVCCLPALHVCHAGVSCSLGSRWPTLRSPVRPDGSCICFFGLAAPSSPAVSRGAGDKETTATMFEVMFLERMEIEHLLRYLEQVANSTEQRQSQVHRLRSRHISECHSSHSVIDRAGTTLWFPVAQDTWQRHCRIHRQLLSIKSIHE